MHAGEEDEANTGRIWLHGTQNGSPGLIGFAMSARKEPKGELVRCVFNASEDSQSLDTNHVESCRRLDLFHNMIFDGQNGSYRTIEVRIKGIQRPCLHEAVYLSFVGHFTSERISSTALCPS